MIDSISMPGALNEQRKMRRFPLTAKVTAYDASTNAVDVVNVWDSVNVSADGGGMYVAAPQPPALGARLEVGFTLPGFELEIVAQAQVMWVNAPGRGTFYSSKPSGMGLKFVDLDPEYVRMLREYVDELLLQGAKDASPATGRDEQLATGTVLGSYRVIQWLGSDGVGDTYLAEHMQLERRVAIKRLRSELADNRESMKRFFDEARAVNRLRHENIVEITDFVSDSAHTYFVMELLEGRTLAEAQARDGVLPLPRALHIAIQLCDALVAVHSVGIVHRQLQPQSIMLIERAGKPDFVKVLDFGVAMLMSPEQLPGTAVGHRADIYAIGVLLQQMTMGTNDASVPAELEEIIQRCLEKEPGKRPESVWEIGERLRAVPMSASGAPGREDSMQRASVELLEVDLPVTEVVEDRRVPLFAVVLTTVVVALAGGLWLARHHVGLSPRALSSEPSTAAPRHVAPVAETAPQAASVAEVPPSPAPPQEASVPTAQPSPARAATTRARAARPAPIAKVESATVAKPAVVDDAATDMHCEQGKMLLSESKALLAVDELQKCVARNPKLAKSYRLLGKALVMVGREPAAIAAFEKFVELAPDHKDAEKLRQIIADYHRR